MKMSSPLQEFPTTATPSCTLAQRLFPWANPQWPLAGRAVTSGQQIAMISCLASSFWNSHFLGTFKLWCRCFANALLSEFSVQWAYIFICYQKYFWFILPTLFRWVGAAFDGRHGAAVASPWDWELLRRWGQGQAGAAYSHHVCVHPPCDIFVPSIVVFCP